MEFPARISHLKYSNPELFLVLVSSAGLFLLGLILLFLLPTQIATPKSPTKVSLDTNFKFSLFGFTRKESLEIRIDPPLAYKIDWGKNANPLSQDLVIKPENLLGENTTYKVSIKTANFLGVEDQYTETVQTEPLPVVLSSLPVDKSANISSESKIKFVFDKNLAKGKFLLRSNPDFAYHSSWNNNELTFEPLQKLKQGQSYQMILFLETTPKTLTVLRLLDFATTPALSVIQTDPANLATIVPKNQIVKLVFNKDVAPEALKKAWSLNPATAGELKMIDSRTAHFTPTGFFKTNTTYSLGLNNLKAIDNSYLDGDFSLKFTTAGPAQVKSISPTGGAVAQTAKIYIDFDQDVDQASAQSHFSAQPAISGSFSWSGKTMIFNPSSLGLLTTYNLTISPGVKSLVGEDSNQSFKASFTTTSERSRTIGYSVKGRPIVATYFGLGPKKILLIGAIHGSEFNTGNMLLSWMGYLRSHQTQFGAERTFIVIPFSNPDGKAANSRFNANGVDLNRNWDANWQALTYWLNNSYPQGGGSGPFSEPETRALRDFILSENPLRIISYHSAASVVVGDGISTAFRNWYSAKTGYAISTGGVETFGYAITGTLEEWAQNRGIVTIVVEFSTVTSTEYDRNYPALTGLLSLPL